MSEKWKLRHGSTEHVLENHECSVFHLLFILNFFVKESFVK
jgi:hypothetical protein